MKEQTNRYITIRKKKAVYTNVQVWDTFSIFEESAYPIVKKRTDKNAFSKVWNSLKFEPQTPMPIKANPQNRGMMINM